MRILGIDPGKTTGVALIRNGNFIRGEETRGYQETISWIFDEHPDVVVIEDFQIRPRKPSLYHPSIRMIGVVEYVCQMCQTPMIIQSPSILRLTLNAARGLSKSPHICSAAAHAMYYWRKHGIK